jgi:predicted heme/steroid binding protein
MRQVSVKAVPFWLAVYLTAAAASCSSGVETNQVVRIRAAGFVLGTASSANDGTNHFQFALENSGSIPFSQSAIKQGAEPAKLGPNPKSPYFTVRFALPVPPENVTNEVAALAGIDPMVFTHNHSPGFEILPNGDALAIYFSTPPGKAEADPSTSFIQARLRYGSEDWDLPELFFKTENFNDQSGLLWNDGEKIRFFGGGRDLSDVVPFKMANSSDNGATWTFSIPQLAQPAENYTAQPITSAFRGADGAMYFAMDGDKTTSFLWRSADDGSHWQQMAGRTGGRHSVIVPIDDKGALLSIGGKNAATNGWSPQNSSTNYGASWSESSPSPFPPLGSAQRPSLIKLADGNLFFASDAYLHKLVRPPPAGWNFGNGAFVALSTNNGVSWRVKLLPVQLPNHERGTNGTLGYVTARQAPNGVIHVLTTETQPCLHYELNEAWILSNVGDIAPETSGGIVKKFSEDFPDGKIRSQWRARICPNGRYLLEGKETDFYESGAKQHQAAYQNGRKTGEETFWSADGKIIWRWQHDLKNHRAVWTRYWSSGGKMSESNWNTQPEARDLKRSFVGLVADGSVKQWHEDGSLKFSGNFSNGLLLKEENH